MVSPDFAGEIGLGLGEGPVDLDLGLFIAVLNAIRDRPDLGLWRPSAVDGEE